MSHDVESGSKSYPCMHDSYSTLQRLLGLTESKFDMPWVPGLDDMGGMGNQSLKSELRIISQSTAPFFEKAQTLQVTFAKYSILKFPQRQLGVKLWEILEKLISEEWGDRKRQRTGNIRGGGAW